MAPETHARGGGPRALFESELSLVREVTRFVCRRHSMSPEDAEEFSSAALLKLIDNDYAVFRKFEARSSLRTYLTIVIDRYSIDYLIAKNGKWRPSAQSVSMGPWAVELDRLLNRDGYSPHEAVQTLLARQRPGITEEKLLEAARRIPPRPRRTFESGGSAPLPAGVGAAADRLVRDAERAAAASRVRQVLARALQRLSPEDRLVARLRFVEGWSSSRIAAAIHREPSSVYRRVERLKKSLRTQFRKEGIERPIELSGD